nr:hypothetical protein [Tanacetum cinerariifolium]
MNPVATQQVALDNSLIAPEKRLKIEKCNARIAFSKPQIEETYQVTLDALKLSPFYPTFQITTEVLEIYMHQFWTTTKRIRNSDTYSFKLEKKKRIIGYIHSGLGYSGKCNMLSAIHTDQMHQPWRTFAAIINRTLSPVKDAKPVKKAKRVKRPAKKSTTMPTIGVVIRDTPGVSISKKKAPAKGDKSKGIELLFDAALLKAAQVKKALWKSKMDSHMLHASGSGDGVCYQPKVLDKSKNKTTSTDEGTGTKPGVPDVPLYESDSDNESWGDSEDESDDINDDEDDDDNINNDDNENEDDDGNDAHDSERTGLDDDDENLSFTLKYYDEEEYDEDYESNDDYENVYEEEDDNLYKDVDVRSLGVEHEKERKEDSSQVNEVHSDDNHIFDNLNHQLAQEMHQEEHLGFDDEYDFLTNTIPYKKLSLVSDAKNVSTEAYAATSDQIAMIAILNNLTSQRNQRNAELLKENKMLKSTLSAKDKSIEFLKSEKEKVLTDKKELVDSYLDDIVSLRSENRVTKEMLQRFNMPTHIIPMLSKKPRRSIADLHQDILECLRNQKVCEQPNATACNAIFEINKLKAQLQEKDDTIRHLHAEKDILGLTSLKIQNDGYKVTNANLNKCYQELSKANTHLRTTSLKKIATQKAEIATLKAEAVGKKSSGPTDRSMKSVHTKPHQAKRVVNTSTNAWNATKNTVTRFIPIWKPTGRRFNLHDIFSSRTSTEPIVKPLELTPFIMALKKTTTRSSQATTTPTTTHVIDEKLRTLIAQGVVDMLAERDATRSKNGIDIHDSRTCEFALMCARMFPEDSDKIERYVGGLPDIIHESVMTSKPKTMQEVIEFTTKQGVAIAYTVGSGERKEYAGTLPLCNKCKFHHNGQCTVIENDNSWVSVPKTTQENGVSVTKMSVPATATAKEKINKKNDVKARSLLLMALPNEHQLTISQYNDAKTIFLAIET